MRSDIENVDYWRQLNPQCTISDNPWLQKPVHFKGTKTQAKRHLEQLVMEGYFQTEPVISPEIIEPLIDCIINVVRAGHLSTYALLYDEFYHIYSRLGKILTPILGADFQFVPDEFEAYYIPVSDNASGSGPHRDSLQPSRILDKDGVPQLVNVWIPLTDATNLNSCMSVVPLNLEGAGDLEFDPDLWQETPSIDILQNVRSLPAKAGSILCWNPMLLHWGGRSSRFADMPRLSIAAYFQNSSRPQFHPTTMDIPTPIPFKYRLYLVEKVWRDPAGKFVFEFI